MIYLDMGCTNCSDPANQQNQGTVLTVRAQSTGVILDKLTVKTSAGSFSVGASSLKNCNYSNTCHFNFKGEGQRADLYGHSGTTTAPKPTPSPTPKSTYSPKPVPKSTYSPKPVAKTTYSPKPVVKSPAPVYVKKATTPVSQATSKPVVSTKPKVIPVPVPTQSPTPEAIVQALPSSSLEPSPANIQATGKSHTLGTSTIVGLGIATLALLVFAAMFIIRRRHTS
ncbi:MAG: hypothetical protein ABIS59_02655 [Candidatus Saccharibacteria bacterium]